MYALKPTRIYVLDAALKNAAASARVGRMVKAIGSDMIDAVVFGRGQAHDVAREIGQWPGDDLDEATPPSRQRPLVFTMVKTDAATEAEAEANAAADPWVADRPEDVEESILKAILGHIRPVKDTHIPAEDYDINFVCWNTQDFGCMLGCPHGCRYCGWGRNGKYIAIAANVEEYVEKVVDRVVREHPHQKCFRMIGWGADYPAFEPEYGMFDAFLTQLAKREDRYGYFHTNSHNLDWVEHVAHRERLIGVWSLACEGMADRIEPGAPSAAERIQAMAKCQDWGVPVRIKFKPAIPVRNWREEYAALIEEIFKQVRPESIGFGVLMWMDIARVAECFGLDLLDPEFVQAAYDAREAMEGKRQAPFPHDARKEMYRFFISEIRKHDAKIPLYVSTESREMWDDLAEELGQSKERFMCGCNPIQLPGPRLAPSGSIMRSTYCGANP